MADLFPDIPQIMDPAETHIKHNFSHLIACVNHGRAPGELCYPNGVAIDAKKNQIYVTEGFYSYEGFPNNISRVSIFSETGEFLNTFSHPDMKWPYGVAVHGDNIYVTDKFEHILFHFKVGADFLQVAKLGSRGSGIGQFDEPRQLAVSTNGDVFVADFCNDRIQILDSDLHYQRYLSHHSLIGPRDVKLTEHEVYILCQTSPCVKVFSYPGGLLRSLIPRGDVRMQVIHPSFFCLDADSNLILCGWTSHQIKIFSKKGTLLHTLGNHGHEVGMFNSPQGIALIDHQKLVIVSENKNCRLQIFSFD